MNQKLTTKEWLIQTVTPVVLPLVKLYWFVFRPHTEGVKVVLRNENGEFLFVRHAYGSGDWMFPGGGIEARETPKQTVRREMREELAVDISELQVHDSFVSTREYKRDHITVCSGGVLEDIQTSPFEIADIRWFAADDLPELRPVTKEVLTIYEP